MSEHTFSSRAARMPHTVIYLLMPLEGIGVFVFLCYAAFHWAAFTSGITALISWIAWFGALCLYTGLAYLVIKVVRAGLETVAAFAHAGADIQRKFIDNNAARTRKELLHTDPNYVVYLQNGKVTVQSILAERSYRQLPEQALLSEVETVDTIESLPAPVQTFNELLRAGVIQSAFSQGKMLLGYAGGELRYGSWLDLYSCGIGGVSGSGKTTTVRFLLFQAILAGARLLMIDPHIGDEEESLAAQFRCFEDIHLMPPCDENEKQIARRVRWLMKEYLHRKSEGIKGPAIIFVIDELNACVRRMSDELKKEFSDLLLTIAQEGRKFGIFAMLIGQRWSEQDLGGKGFGAAIRSSLSSSLAHRFTDEDQAKKLVGSKHGPKCLELDQGHYYFRDTHGILTEMITPHTIESDGIYIQQILDSRNQPETSQKPARNQISEIGIPDTDPCARNLLESGVKAQENAVDTEPLESQDAALNEKMKSILKMQAGGKQKAEIIKTLWGVSPGGSSAYEQANTEYQQALQLAFNRLGA